MIMTIRYFPQNSRLKYSTVPLVPLIIIRRDKDLVPARPADLLINRNQRRVNNLVTVQQPGVPAKISLIRLLRNRMTTQSPMVPKVTAPNLDPMMIRALAGMTIIEVAPKRSLMFFCGNRFSDDPIEYVVLSYFNFPYVGSSSSIM